MHANKLLIILVLLKEVVHYIEEFVDVVVTWDDLALCEQLSILDPLADEHLGVVVAASVCEVDDKAQVDAVVH